MARMLSKQAADKLRQPEGQSAELMNNTDNTTCESSCERACGGEVAVAGACSSSNPWHALLRSERRSRGPTTRRKDEAEAEAVYFNE